MCCKTLTMTHAVWQSNTICFCYYWFSFICHRFFWRINCRPNNLNIGVCWTLYKADKMINKNSPSKTVFAHAIISEVGVVIKSMSEISSINVGDKYTSRLLYYIWPDIITFSIYKIKCSVYLCFFCFFIYIA